MPASQTFPLPDGYRPRGQTAPWWIGDLLVDPLRRLFQDPARLLGHVVAAGQTVLEVGPGLGFFTLPLARLVGARGRVIGVDCQPRRHVPRDVFLWEYGLCREAGLRAVDWPRQRGQMTVVMAKDAAAG